MPHPKIYDLGHSRISLMDNGIVKLVCGDDVVYDIKEIRENLKCIAEIGKGKRLPVMNVGGKYTLVTKEGREFVAKAEYSRKMISAEGYVMRSTAQKMIAGFYMRINKPKMPTRFFTNEEGAIKWLKKFLPDQI
ncbi:MAG: hypothetical protein HY064_15730 [Bacteroidetes bacterium]|nr:hypothetical protein [Bacteroidota bacterium]